MERIEKGRKEEGRNGRGEGSGMNERRKEGSKKEGKERREGTREDGKVRRNL